jgi:hypothetical protein
MVTPEKMITPGNETVINSARALLNILLLF